MGPEPNGPYLRKLRDRATTVDTQVFFGVRGPSVQWVRSLEIFLGLFLFSKVGPFRNYPKFPGEAAFCGSHDLTEQQESNPGLQVGFQEGLGRFSRKCENLKLHKSSLMF